MRIASDVARNSVLAHMKTAFNPWVNQLTKEMSGEMAKLSGPGSTAPIDAAKVGKLYTSIANTDNRKSLIGILKNNAKIFPNIDPKNPPSGDALKSQLLARIQEVRDAKWAPGELEARSQLIVRLTTDPTAVFGTSVKDTTGKRKRQDVVSKPSVMQYLERGFTRNDPMQPGGAGGKSKKGVFNAAFIKCMMMFGFDTLAAYSSTDTMHFDYVKGFDSIRGKSGDEYAPVG